MEKAVFGNKEFYMIRCNSCKAMNYIYALLYDGKTFTCGKCRVVGKNKNML